MGEARRRRQRLAIGDPDPRDRDRCPRCRNLAAVTTTRLPSPVGGGVVTTLAGCTACGAVWEAYPADWVGDVCEPTAERCDNCAFRLGSPEAGEREGWRQLLAQLKAGGMFNCHKGAPIIITTAEDGGLTAEFDADWISRHGRVCVGFHRAVMTGPGWLERRYGQLTEPAGD